MVAMATNSEEENRGKEDKKNKRIHPTMRAKKQSFRKRKDCVLKKSMELSVLCDIKVCAIVIDANGKVETWPENKDDLMKIAKLYKDSLDRKDGCDKKRVVEIECGQEATSEAADQHQIILHPQHEWEDTENGKEANSEVAGRQLISHSQHEPEEIDSSIEGSSADEFLSDINDPMNDNMPAALVARDDEQAMEPGIVDDQINPWYSFDDRQNIDEWLNALLNWNSFEQDALVLDTLDTRFLV
ncbi:uncharacterized protein LOC113777996 [Coffea eugenioides]|uniref:uncharacterized protein LOC113777996 n=1 Tax=Coffea eugenioides TaxID=49369 RepID=UPI000F606A2C|nr:uncharacterized protein LOC113777996 [Coffea eugenioides]